MSFPKIYNIDRFVTIRDQFEGFHKYEDAPPEVAFLKNLHRHIFKVEVDIGVEHQDREIEFFMAKEHLKRAIANLAISAGDLGSCETMAEQILRSLMKIYGDYRFYAVEISEDGENSGSVIYDPRNQESNAIT